MVQMDSEHRLNKLPPPAVRLIFLLNSCSDVCGWPVATYASLHYHGNWRGMYAGSMLEAGRSPGELFDSREADSRHSVCLQAHLLQHHTLRQWSENSVRLRGFYGFPGFLFLSFCFRTHWIGLCIKLWTFVRLITPF